MMMFFFPFSTLSRYFNFLFMVESWFTFIFGVNPNSLLGVVTYLKIFGDHERNY